LASENLVGRLLEPAKRLIPEAAAPFMARAFDAGTELAERIVRVRDPLTPPLRLRLHVGPFVDPRVYRLSAERNVLALRELCDLETTAHVLDIGCGCGRMAAAFTRFLDRSGTYDGFDAAREPVEWCQEHIASRFSNFRFRCSDTFSLRYNPGGTVRAADLTFPYEINRFDLTFSASVYTHMMPEEVANFVRETARVLRPGGHSFATFCLLNDRTLPLVAAGNSSPLLPYSFEGCRVRDLGDPASFIAQQEASIRELYSKAGLRIIEPIRYGTWAGPTDHLEMSSPHGFNQDIVIGVKLSSNSESLSVGLAPK
jgi:SAM-dependent methyltransferase